MVAADPDREKTTHATPTGAPCPRTVRLDGTVEGTGACFACGTCLLFGDLVEISG